MTDTEFTRKGLTGAGYSGWLVFPTVVTPDVGQTISTEGGTYLAWRESTEPPEFLKVSPAGWHKRKDPTVSASDLAANWVDGAQVVYIGKATRIVDRVCSMARQGLGKNAGHHGGRLVWQLQDGPSLLIAWRELRPGFATPRADEVDMIARFRALYGKAPFANDPRRLGK